VAPRQPAAAAADPAPEPASEWFRFTGPYPVVLVARGLLVEPKQVVHHPDGPPDTANWTPVKAPATAGDGDASEES
jgi:hypothetical protein